MQSGRQTPFEYRARLLVTLAVYRYRQLPFTTVILLDKAGWEVTDYYSEKHADIRQQVQEALAKLETEPYRYRSDRSRVRIREALTMLKLLELPFLEEDLLLAADCSDLQLRQYPELIEQMKRIQTGSPRSRIIIATGRLRGTRFTINTLAMEAGISKMTLYRSYADLLSLIQEAQSDGEPRVKLTVALEQFRRRGEPFTIDDLVGAAKLSRVALYRHHAELLPSIKAVQQEIRLRSGRRNRRKGR